MTELLIAFGAGLISFLSPCVLPLIPGYISYISGSSLNDLIEIKKVSSETDKSQLEAVFELNLTDESLVMEIAANDGYLLKNFVSKIL